MFNYILKSAGLAIAGCIVGVSASESIIVIRRAKKLRDEFKDLKLLESIKEAAKRRVEEIKGDPREIIFPLYAGFASGMSWALGNWGGWHRGWKQGVFDGIKEGVIGLEKQWIGRCPKEFRKFIDIIMKNNFPDEVEIFRQRTGRKANEYRWWGWSPSSLLNEWDDLAAEVAEVKEA